MIKEFKGHLLQQSVSQAAHYFGSTLPARLETRPMYRDSLPPKNPATGTWPVLSEAFRSEAEIFSRYINERWGLAAGRVWKNP